MDLEREDWRGRGKAKDLLAGPPPRLSFAEENSSTGQSVDAN